MGHGVTICMQEYWARQADGQDVPVAPVPDVISLESVSSVACATGVEPFPSVSAGAETGEAPFAAVVLELPQSVGENPTQVTDGSEHKDDDGEAAKPGVAESLLGADVSPVDRSASASGEVEISEAVKVEAGQAVQNEIAHRNLCAIGVPFAETGQRHEDVTQLQKSEVASTDDLLGELAAHAGTARSQQEQTCERDSLPVLTVEVIRPPEADGKWRRRRPNRKRNRGGCGRPDDGEASEVGVA